MPDDAMLQSIEEAGVQKRTDLGAAQGYLLLLY